MTEEEMLAKIKEIEDAKAAELSKLNESLENMTRARDNEKNEFAQYKEKYKETPPAATPDTPPAPKGVEKQAATVSQQADDAPKGIVLRLLNSEASGIAKKLEFKDASVLADLIDPVKYWKNGDLDVDAYTKAAEDLVKRIPELLIKYCI